MSDTICKYCKKVIPEKSLDTYRCQACHLYAHLVCMDSKKPSELKGDYLFTYECKDCSFERQDHLTRMKINWAQALHLVLYNLTITESGRKGFFRWKEDICNFLDKHWNNLMPDRTRTSNWSSTVAGVLSVHSKKIFKSGQMIFNESGWWGLQKVTWPTQLVEDYKVVKPSSNTSNNSKQTGSELGRGKRQRKEKKLAETVLKKKAKHFDNEKTALQPEVLAQQEREPLHTSIEKENLSKETSNHSSKLGSSNSFSNLDIKIKDEPFDFDMDPCNETELTFQDNPISDMLSDSNLIFNPVDEVLSSDIVTDTPSYTPSPCNSESNENTNTFTTKSIKEEPRRMSRNNSGNSNTVVKCKDTEKQLIPLTPKEESELLSQMNTFPNAISSDASYRRLRRKLINRKLKREIGLKLFDIDATMKQYLKRLYPDQANSIFTEVSPTEDKNEPDDMNEKENTNPINHPALEGINVLDRFINYNYINQSVVRKKTFFQLIGHGEEIINTQRIISPYTSRVLKPYIRRDFSTFPKKLKLLRDIRKRFGNDDDHRQWPIDYCYVQPNHIPAVNSLCAEFFWPGIDLTECLKYPEFSCVVLYRKLLIGFAFMVPDVNYNEAYISFIFVHPDWQRAGIATYMIYHLIQTCMGKDITLHVSPSNPSMILYQKFGFKTEELILDFYEKYIPSPNKGSKHAFFLRLQR